MMIIDFYSVKGYLNIDGDADDNIIKRLHLSAEAQIKSFFDREFCSTSYFECYDGKGTPHLYLPQMPITAVSYLGTKTPAIKIKNTTTTYNNAYVTIDDTNLTLTLNSTGTDLALGTYTTLTTLIAAINAVGNGWSAEIYDSDYASYLSANLVQVQNFFCGSWNGVEATWSYLNMLDKPLAGYQVYGDEGQGYIYYSGGFPRGSKNIAIKYTAGYSDADMPEDLKQLVIDMVDGAYQQKAQGIGGNVKSFRIGQYSVTYGEKTVIEDFSIFYDKYRKVRA